MKTLCALFIAMLLCCQLRAQVADTAISLLPKTPIVKTRCTAKVVGLYLFAPTLQPVPSFTYNQGQLPFFCAMEDRFWRKAGIGFQFRIAESLPGKW